ncbi:GGDEF domain-containing protein [Myxococcus sp. CA051A]|uniref:diguanylate cyclase n=1 Tax=Myxococcus llanfairpwllgwyngyllgogerychwyrndrobwllllantysiliogogogochensis TaxID=2590453 RepID=A0A540WYZ7_9BACT|nr:MULTISPECIES: GGDEF domain-containing protein [Myxococcus]NTX01086.1 GGDEF domain-containing protein [Myxococcus sp. CA040A]NTX12208.1 GGDEF domain-containing protein [Myxococcus sp. CA056]NTX33223.1 GGDEF domain-containing protein [Myxococcus sp. CA033]NTX58420.1 GGDEF domain-containing protein [Myxococcus sp. CA039A]NTX59712.1 GGDEF domain-containing protein [Myxococcus sp. CA051A]
MSEEKTSVHSISDLLGNGQRQSAYLIVISAKSAAGIGRMFKLDRSEVVLGRSSEAQFQVEDDGISRKHAKVVALGDGRFQVVDLASTNGTYLNGLKVNAAPLYDGDKIQIGSNTVLKFSIQDELEEQYQRSIYESATRDGLTRVYNKKYFLETVRKEFSYCLRHRVNLSLVLFDVDHFKKINDAYGHPAGDYVLTRIAQRVSDTVRTEDLLARYGGEEFALMLRESAEDQALACAERCRYAVDKADFVFGGTPIKVTISLGVATLLDSDFSQPEDLIAAADKYLYRAKRAGRNRSDAKAISGP